MSKNGKGFSTSDKGRIMRAESIQHGQIRPDSFASKVQSKVDTAASSKPAGAATPPVSSKY